MRAEIRSLCRMIGALTVVLSVVGCLKPGKESNVVPAEGAAPPGLASFDPRIVDLGKLRCGGKQRTQFALTNRSAAAVEVTTVKSSCECLQFELAHRQILPGHTIEARVNLDLQSEPTFVGDLALDVVGIGIDGQQLFAIVVLVSVVPEGEQLESSK